MYRHHLRLSHSREALYTPTTIAIPAESSINVEVATDDLVTAWRELLTKLPDEVFDTLKEVLQT